MRVFVIIVLLVIVGIELASRNIINTEYNSNKYYYKVDKIKPFNEEKEAVYYINSRHGEGKSNILGRYDNLEIIDSIGAFDIGDEIILVPTKK